MARRTATVAIVLVLLLGAVAPVIQGASTTWKTSGDIHIETDNNMTVVLPGYDNVPQEVFDNASSVNLPGGHLRQAKDGTAWVEPAGKLNKSTTVLNNLSVTNSPIWLNPDNRKQVRINGSGAKSLIVGAPNADDGNVDATVVLRSSGGADIVWRGLSGSTDYYITDDDDRLIDQNTSTAGGELWLDIPAGTGDTVTSGGTSADLYLKQGSVNDTSPQLTNLKPSGVLDYTPDYATVDLNYTNFDNKLVTLEWRLDGQTIDIDIADENDTYDAPLNLDEGGQHEIEVIADDGNNIVSKSTTFTLNGTLYIRNESQPSQIVDDVNITLKVYGRREIVQKNSTNGVIDLDSLPEGEMVVATVEDSNGTYYSRTFVLETDGKVYNMYLLPKNETSVEVRFELQDYTGNFPPSETAVIIQRGLKRNNVTRWRSIAGDLVGVNGYTETLRDGTRYRIVIENTDGDKRILRAYEATTSETVELQPEKININPDDDDANLTYDAVRENVSGSERIRISYVDEDRETDALDIAIYERGNQSNVLSTTNISGPLGETVVIQPLNASTENTTWVVEIDAERGTEDDVHAKIILGYQGADPIPELPDWVRHGGATAMIILTGAVFSKFNRAAGAVTVGMLGGGLWFVGWLPAAAGGGAVLALLLGATFKMAQERGV